MPERWDAIAQAAAPVGVEVGPTISQSFSIWARNLVPFTLIMLLVMLPELLWGAALMTQLTPEGLTPGVARHVGWFVIGTVVLGFVLQPVAAGAIIYGVFRQLRGEPAGLGACLAAGFRLLLPVLGVAFVSALIVLGGFVLLVIPGIIFSIALFVAVPVAVVEKKGVMDSIRRSFELTAGSRWRIFGVVFVIGIIERVISAGFEQAVTGGTGAGASLSELKAWLIIVLALGLLFGAVSAVASALVYHKLKVQKEGADAEALAAVFD